MGSSAATAATAAQMESSAARPATATQMASSAAIAATAAQMGSSAAIAATPPSTLFMFAYIDFHTQDFRHLPAKRLPKKKSSILRVSLRTWRSLRQVGLPTASSPFRSTEQLHEPEKVPFSITTFEGDCLTMTSRSTLYS
jgi:hypothetical protein